MRRSKIPICLLGAAALLALAACAAGPLIDRVPTEMGGLPSNAPQRSAAPPAYPAVHDVPAPRPIAPMSDQDQLKVERELDAARKRQETLQDPTAKDRAAVANATSNNAMEKAKAAAKKKPSAPNDQ